MAYPSADEQNIRKSFKQYLLALLELDLLIDLDIFFDVTMIDPARLHDKSLKNWVVVHFGKARIHGLSDMIIDLYCCTRSDPEGDTLSELATLMVDYLTDPLQYDGKKRIPIYDFMFTPHPLVGGMIVEDFNRSEDMMGPDETKYKIISTRLRWVARA